MCPSRSLSHSFLSADGRVLSSETCTSMARTESSSIPERRSSSRVGDTCNVETELTATDPAVARVTFKSRLHQMTQTTPTKQWKDSADIGELIKPIDKGAVGLTCNPDIAVGILFNIIAAVL